MTSRAASSSLPRVLEAVCAPTILHTDQLVLYHNLTFSASQARGSGALAREEVAWPVNTEGDPGAAAPAGAAQELCVCRRFASESFSFVLSFVTPGHSRSWNGVVSLAYARHPCRTYACTAHSTGARARQLSMDHRIKVPW